MDDDLREKRATLRRNSRWLLGHGFEEGHRELERVAAWCAENSVRPDHYGEGEDLQAFEARVAQLLGLPRGRFFPSGKMAQPIALRLWSERAGTKNFGMHPTCHLELHEHRGYSHLHDLEATLVGPPQRPMLAADLAGIRVPLAALVVELPTRENGGQLPSWDELVGLCDLARDRGIHPHLDGARLWEAQAHYGRTFEEICGLFDSVYVSFYKGIGALAGAMLLGPEDFVEEAVVWRTRQGGTLHSHMPNWASAAMNLEERLGRFELFHERAQELARALEEVDGVHPIPDPPHTNLFHLWLDAPEEALLSARDRVAEEMDLWLFAALSSTELPGTARLEVYVGEAALGLEVAEVARGFQRLIELTREA